MSRRTYLLINSRLNPSEAGPPVSHAIPPRHAASNLRGGLYTDDAALSPQHLELSPASSFPTRGDRPRRTEPKTSNSSEPKRRSLSKNPTVSTHVSTHKQATFINRPQDTLFCAHFRVYDNPFLNRPQRHTFINRPQTTLVKISNSDSCEIFLIDECHAARQPSETALQRRETRRHRQNRPPAYPGRTAPKSEPEPEPTHFQNPMAYPCLKRHVVYLD